jgi:CBS domain-containing protein
MKVTDKMTRHVRVASPDDTIQQVARVMAQADAGVLPVGENNRLVDMVTDRDIAVHGVAQRKGLDTPVREVMTADVRCCFEDEDLDTVARRMGEQQVRRLPVMNGDKRLVGILSLGDIVVGRAPQPAGDALAGVLRAAGAIRKLEVTGAGRSVPMRMRIAPLVVAVAVALAAGAASAQPTAPAPLSIVPERIEPERTEPPRTREEQDRAGGPTDGDVQRGGPGTIQGGVVRPPAGVDPGIQVPVPNPSSGTMPVIPPPGTPGGAPGVQPR